MSFEKKRCLCGVYKVMKLSKVPFSDQIDKMQLPNHRKKYNLDEMMNRYKIVYQFQEYLKILNQTSENVSKNWNQAVSKLPNLFHNKSIADGDSNESNPNTPNRSKNEVKDESSSTVRAKDVAKIEKKDSTYKLPLIGGWRSKQFSNAEIERKDSVPKWKTDVTIASSADVLSRTKQLLFLIDKAESVQSRVKRIEDLIAFISQNSDARLMAVKNGAIKKLLHIKRRTKDSTTHQILREAFALLGHVDSLPNKGIRILTVDGGGIRGIAVVDMLRKLEELTGKRIYELFDYICGVSTGSILVSCIGTPRGLTMQEADIMYTEFGTKLFTQSAFWGVGNLVLNRAYYDTTMFEQLLKRFVGETPLIKTNRDANCPKLASVSTVMNRSSIMPFVFRNYSLPYDRQSQYIGSCKYSLYESVRASGAAPTVFQEFCLDGIIHQDGGILVNNPCAVAIHEAKLLWPNSEIQCVVSCGTGRRAPTAVAAYSSEAVNKASSVSWKTLIHRILESATDTEAVHTMCNDLLPPNVYFRFNPYLTDVIPMHEIRSDKVAQLREETGLYIRKNEEKFVDAATSLLVKRTASQRIRDFVEAKYLEYGLNKST